jgi:hypothetical protein
VLWCPGLRHVHLLVEARDLSLRAALVAAAFATFRCELVCFSSKCMSMACASAVLGAFSDAMYFPWASKHGLGFFEGGSPSSAEVEERVAGFPAREASSGSIS